MLQVSWVQGLGYMGFRVPSSGIPSLKFGGSELGDVKCGLGFRA